VVLLNVQKLRGQLLMTHPPSTYVHTVMYSSVCGVCLHCATLVRPATLLRICHVWPAVTPSQQTPLSTCIPLDSINFSFTVSNVQCLHSVRLSNTVCFRLSFAEVGAMLPGPVPAHVGGNYQRSRETARAPQVFLPQWLQSRFTV